MTTLETQNFNFKPDINKIRKQCDSVVQRDPSLRHKILAALKNFDDAMKYVDSVNVPKALEKLNESVRDILDVGADELEASCFFYMGFIGLAAGGAESGINLLNAALHRTQNPLLALVAYNRLMIHHLTDGNYETVINLANATDKVVSKLPNSNTSRYFSSAASYSRAEAHFRQGKYSNALPHIQEALTGFSDLSMKAEIAKCQGLRGNALIFSGQLKQGLKDIETSLKLFRELKNEREIQFLLLGRASVMCQMGKKAEAIQDLREALKISKRLGEINEINSTLALLSALEAE